MSVFPSALSYILFLVLHPNKWLHIKFSRIISYIFPYIISDWAVWAVFPNQLPRQSQFPVVITTATNPPIDSETAHRKEKEKKGQTDIPDIEPFFL